MAISGCHIDQNWNFLIKTIENWIYSKIKSSALFSLKFWHNTLIGNTKMKLCDFEDNKKKKLRELGKICLLLQKNVFLKIMQIYISGTEGKFWKYLLKISVMCYDGHGMVYNKQLIQVNFEIKKMTKKKKRKVSCSLLVLKDANSKRPTGLHFAMSVHFFIS